MAESRTSETRRLAALVGRWKTEGETRESGMTIDATDTYEWLPGGFALLHRVDALVGEEKVEGAEIIGYDPERGCYITKYFGSDGPNSYEARLEDEGGRLVWRMQSSTDRFTGTFSGDRERIEGHWEQLGPDSRWTPWMDVTLTKSD